MATRTLLELLAVGLLFVGFVYERRSRRKDAVRFPPPGRFIDVGGRRLHLLIEGREGPTVVVEQGAGGSSLAWLGLQKQISKFARACLYDRAGYQWSDAVSGPRDLGDRVEDLHALLANAGLPAPYVLVGHSYGGFLVRLFAKKYPGSVAGLVLVDTPHEQTYYQPAVLARYAQINWILRGMKVLSIFGVPRLINRCVAKPEPSLPAEVGEQINAAMVRSEYFAAASDDIRSLERAAPWLTEPDPFGHLGEIPVAVITHGRPFPGPFAVLEKGWREGQERLAALSGNGVLIVAENANHMIHMDQPEVIVEAIQNVVERSRKTAV